MTAPQLPSHLLLPSKGSRTRELVSVLDEIEAAKTSTSHTPEPSDWLFDEHRHQKGRHAGSWKTGTPCRASADCPYLSSYFGMCSGHYWAVRAGRNPETVVLPELPVCAEPLCRNEAVVKGFCMRCYSRSSQRPLMQQDHAERLDGKYSLVYTERKKELASNQADFEKNLADTEDKRVRAWWAWWDEARERSRRIRFKATRAQFNAFKKQMPSDRRFLPHGEVQADRWGAQRNSEWERRWNATAAAVNEVRSMWVSFNIQAEVESGGWPRKRPAL